MKYKIMVLSALIIGCQTTNKCPECSCEKTANTALQTSFSTDDKIRTEDMTVEEKLNIASDFLNNNSSEDALDILHTIPKDAQSNQYKKLKQDAINKSVVSLRYKVRVLYEKSVSQSGKSKLESLKQSKKILKNIIKSYPEYGDMYSVKNNLNQIEKELKKTHAS